MLFTGRERESIFELIGAIHMKLNRLAQRKLKDLNLTYPQFGALMVLTERSMLCQRELAAVLETDTTTTMVICNGLEDKGLIERQRDPNDKRAYQLVITEKGRELYQQAYMAVVGLYGPISRAFSDEEVTHILASLGKTFTLIQEQEKKMEAQA